MTALHSQVQKVRFIFAVKIESGYTDIDYAPRISPSTNFLPIDVKHAIGTDNGERQLGIDLRRLLWELIQMYIRLLDLLHNLFLKRTQFFGCHGVCFANHRDNIDLK